MVVAIKLIIVSILFLTSCATADVAEKSEGSSQRKYKSAVLNRYMEEYEKSASKLDEKMEYCETIAEKRVVEFDATKLAPFSKDEIIDIFAYLEERNSKMCEGDVRKLHAYSYRTVLVVAQEYGESLNLPYNERVLYPFKDFLEREQLYSEMSDENRQFFTETIGDQPFNIVKTLRHNQVISE